jgi:hypothetical protein
MKRQPEAARQQCSYKVNADSGNVALSVGVVGKAEQQARLPHARVADEQELEEVVVSGPVSVYCGRNGVTLMAC